ncbi:signal peptidase I [Neptuniibacter sp. QD37_11]|uniref:signal peptidase I n=1 Tax=Neptuniibacter sp. QD37_11 TaxID=3398209 RepID=UPI0039F61704
MKTIVKTVLALSITSAVLSVTFETGFLQNDSMSPNASDGQIVVYNHIAYDLHQPYSDQIIMSLNNPVRGDFVTLNRKYYPHQYGRVVALPNEVVSMNNFMIQIYGQSFRYNQYKQETNKHSQPVAIYASEETDKGIYGVRITASPNASFQPSKVPEGVYMVIPDNRITPYTDHRYLFVPREHITGKVITF